LEASELYKGYDQRAGSTGGRGTDSLRTESSSPFPLPMLGKNIRELVEKEVAVYQSLEVIRLDSDPKRWWASHAQTLPFLHAAAVRYLSIPATCTNAADYFQSVGMSIPKLRASMTTRNVGENLFLKRNLERLKGITMSMRGVDFERLDDGPDSEDEDECLPWPAHFGVMYE